MKAVICSLIIIAGLGTALWFVPPSSPASNRTSAMRTSQLISANDCAMMAEVLKTQAKQTTDEYLMRNADGRFNCPFAKYSIAQTIYVETQLGYASRENSYHLTTEEKQKGLAEFLKHLGSYYAETPRYSLFRTRLKIEYGRAYGGGSICTYNRFTGKWKLEAPCKSTWIA